MSINSDIEKKMKAGTNAVERLLTKQEKDLIRLYKESLKEIKKDIANLYEKMGTPSIANSMRRNRLKNMAKSIEAELISLARKSKSVISDSIKSMYSETYNITSYGVQSGLGVDLGFAGLPHDRLASGAVLQGSIIVDGVKQDPFDLIKWRSSVNETISKYNIKIKEGITKGLIKGDSFATMAREIGQVGGKSAGQMMTIIRTEGLRASSQGYLEAFDDVSGSAERLGIGMENKWLTTLDDKARSSHIALDQTFPNEEGNFQCSGTFAPAPRLFPDAGCSINCRCSLTPVVDGLEDTKYRKARENGKSVLVKNQTYKQWSESNNVKTEL